MRAGAGGQFDDVAVGVAEIDRADKAMIDRAAHLDPFRPALFEHAVEDVVFDAERDVQIEIVLPLEVEGPPRRLEEGEARAVIHLEESVEGVALVDLEGADQAKTEEVLVECAGLLGVPAAIRVM